MSDVRVRKLQEFIKQEVSQMLMRGLKDPRIGFTTVTDVHVTGDLREATIYVSFVLICFFILFDFIQKGFNMHAVIQ